MNATPPPGLGRRLCRLASGGGEIRTLEPLARPTVFETAPFNHSGTPPGRPLRLAAGGEERGEERGALLAQEAARDLGPGGEAGARPGGAGPGPGARPPGGGGPRAPSGRWLRRGWAVTSRTEPQAPAFGSTVP